MAMMTQCFTMGGARVAQKRGVHILQKKKTCVVGNLQPKMRGALPRSVCIRQRLIDRRTRSNFISCKATEGGGLPPELKNSIDDFIQENAIVVFIKGTKEMPMCGFSNTVVQILNSMDVPYVSVNILDNDMLRAGMKEYSMWPTFPQVYIGGEFYGGCDIMIESYQRGELHEVVEIALNS
jgi:monothiol glutaredoxin